MVSRQFWNRRIQLHGGTAGQWRQHRLVSARRSRCHGSARQYARIHLRNDASYTPILEGEIVSLDFSIDFLNIDIFGQGQNFGVAILQNGNYYYGSSQITAPGGAIWTPGTATNLGAVDFIEILADASTNNSSHPDFSITGSTIIFGFTTANITGFSGSIDVGYDNWSVSHAAVVPEPSTSFVFFAFAFYGICSRPRRRRALG